MLYNLRSSSLAVHSLLGRMRKGENVVQEDKCSEELEKVDNGPEIEHEGTALFVVRLKHAVHPLLGFK